MNDLDRATAKLATLHPGSRDHGLMAELVARLKAEVDGALRNQVRRAACRDAVAMSACDSNVYRSGYVGQLRPEYLAFLEGYLSALGGTVFDARGDLVAAFPRHSIVMGFGPIPDTPDDAAAQHRRQLVVGLRAAYVDEAEARSQWERGRGLTDVELQQFLKWYPGDVEAD